MATVGLCLITKELTPQTAKLLEGATPYFDHVYIQVNGKGSKDFKWNDNFADARNALLKKVKTDYWCWVDSDDELIGVQNIAAIVERMEREGIDMMYAPYEYLVKDGIVQEVQQRERIVKTSLPGSWHGAVHETWIPESDAVRESTTQMVWRHLKTAEEHKESMIRNRRILEAEYAKEPRDPRIAYYLGLNYGIDNHYEEAIECFRELIKTGDWDEERYRAWLQVFSCYFELGQYEEALQAAVQATLELPEWPDAYFMLQQLYYTMDDHTKALEWFRVGQSKDNPKSDSAFNPVVRFYQPLWLAAYSEFCSGRPTVAMQYAVQADKLSPELGKQWTKLKDEILRAVNEERAVNAAKTLIDYAEFTESDARAVLDALPTDIKSDVRLTAERRRLVPGKQWANGSVVFFCGPGYEAWGPDTLDKGMGGSEEAVVYLSRELANRKVVDILIPEVVVYNERQESDFDSFSDSAYGPIYHPWQEINPNDEFDIFVAWRDPSGLRDINARLKLCDVHDIMPPDVIYDNLPYVDKYLFKSQYHRNLYPIVPDDKCVVIGNGISRSQFK